MNDLSRALREEERKAWTRLIRVLGHELNNSWTSLQNAGYPKQQTASLANADIKSLSDYDHFFWPYTIFHLQLSRVPIGRLNLE